MNYTFNGQKYFDALESATAFKDVGKVTQVAGILIEGFLSGASLGNFCKIYPSFSSKGIGAEVVGFRDHHVLLMPFGDTRGIAHGSRIVLERARSYLSVGPQYLGRVINALGEPLDDGGPLEATDEVPIYRDTSNPLSRPPIREALDLGVRSINGLLTVGKGQRVGIMAGSGVGKSVLMGMIAKSTTADVNIISLVGERGREVREFIENDLGPEGLKKSIVVVATGDQSPLLRMRAAFVSLALSEYFCEQGADVLLMMDSVTRFCMAAREVGLSVGEPPATKGYTPSVFSTLPKLLERAGNYEKGSITGLFTVLVEGDDMDDPIADSVRSIVDGHIVLSRQLAQRGHFPAIDVLQSASRVMRSVVSESHLQAAQKIREMMATYKETEDLINIGAYKKGINPKIDLSVDMHESIDRFLKQKVDERSQFQHALDEMGGIVASV